MINAANLITLSDFELSRFFFAIVLLLCAAHAFGYVFLRLKMPRVIGEIAGGLLLGPTLLGSVSPDSYTWIFNAFAAEPKLISVIYWLGLVLLMFISGFEIDPSFDREDKKTVVMVFLGSTIIPFAAGWLAPNYFNLADYAGTAANITALKIVIGIAFAVTSIPVISKIFIELDMIHTRFAKIVLGTATIHDIILWAALATATALVSTTHINVSQIITTVLATLGFFAASFLILPRVFAKLNSLRVNLLIKSSPAGYALLICFLFAAMASLLNVNIVFGAFMAGVILRTLPDKNLQAVTTNIKEFSFAFFVPIYFAIVGLKIDLLHHFDPLFLIAFMCIGAFFQTIGTILGARLANNNWRAALNLSVAMNARGGPGIVLATVTFELGIINETLFTTLVTSAILTSLVAGYYFRMIKTKNLPLM